MAVTTVIDRYEKCYAVMVLLVQHVRQGAIEADKTIYRICEAFANLFSADTTGQAVVVD